MNNRKVVLKLGDIVIRKYQMSDLIPLAEQFSHPQILKNIRGVKSTYTKKDAREFLKKSMRKKMASRSSIGYRLEYAIDIRGKFAGGIGVTLDGQKAEIGYWIGSNWWNQGYMTKIIRSFSRYVLKKYKIQRIFACVFPFNKASARVLRKSGFQFEGRLRKNYRAGKKYLDILMFSKIAT